jgi:isoquinoline 1-oxidoreductase subunit beta
MSRPISRRGFLTAGTGGFTLVVLAACSSSKGASSSGAASTSTGAAATTNPAATTMPTTTIVATTITVPATTTVAVGAEVFNVGPSLTITDTGLVIVRGAKAEMGQGVLSALAMLMADELDADINSIRIVEQDGMPAIGRGAGGGISYTFASTSMTDSFDPVRQVGATARAMLITAAAARLDVDPSTLSIKSGVISSGSKSVSFAEIATAAGAVPVPEGAKPKAADQRRIVGKDVARFDTAAKVNGHAKFASDVKRDGMLVATLLRGPRLMSSPSKWDEATALAIPGVKSIVKVPGDKLAAWGADDALAIVATGTWAALKGRDALAPTVTWTGGSDATTDAISTNLRQLASTPGVVADDNDVSAIERGAAKVDAIYDIGYAAHLVMEPLTAAADVTATKADIWIGHQAELLARPAIERAIGLNGDAVTFHHMFLGTGFGRRAKGDFAAEAVYVAKQVGAPVRVQWTRDDDIARGFMRPAVAIRVRASLDDKGQFAGIEATVAGDSIDRMDDPNLDLNSANSGALTGLTSETPYTFGVVRTSTHVVKADISIGIWRGVTHNGTVFALESAISEIAVAGTLNEIEMRTKLLDKNPRAAGVLTEVVRLSGWKPATKDRAFGIAMVNYNGTFAATVAEVVTDGSGWKFAKVYGSIDCGLAVSPNGVRAQVEGGIVFGLTSALTASVKLVNGEVQQKNFDQLRALRNAEVPPIVVSVVDSQEKPTGAGEAIVVTVAPAVANAVAALTGTRQRSLPLTGWTGASRKY